MPIHDWTPAPAGFFRHFHQQWLGSICNALNGGVLPRGFFALVEQREAGVEPDVLTVERPIRPNERPEPRGGLAVADAPPRTRFISQASDEDVYAAKANRIVVRRSRGRVVEWFRL